MSLKNLDKSITESVIEIVEMNNQPADLANKILSWLDAVHSGQESLDDKNSYLNRIEVLLDATKMD